MITGIYVGQDARLAGKRALLTVSIDNGQTTAQFDDLDIPEAFGWHPFPASDFRFEKPISESEFEASKKDLKPEYEHFIDPHSHLVGLAEWREYMRGGDHPN